MPVVILQTVSWQQMIPYMPDGALQKVDAGFGTFPVKTDFAMTFFLSMLILVLLFQGKTLVSPKRRYFLLGWYTLTILVANSQIMHIALILIWTIYILSHLRPQVILWGMIGIVILSTAIIVLQQTEWMPLDLSVTFSTLQDQLQGRISGGNYSRGSVFYNFFSQQIDWIGKGPGYYYSVVNRKVEGLDIHGHLLTYYAEVGLIGLVISYMLLWFIAKPIRISKTSIYLSWAAITSFLIIFILSSTSYVLNQLSIVSVYILTLHQIRCQIKA